MRSTRTWPVLVGILLILGLLLAVPFATLFAGDSGYWVAYGSLDTGSARAELTAPSMLWLAAPRLIGIVFVGVAAFLLTGLVGFHLGAQRQTGGPQ